MVKNGKAINKVSMNTSKIITINKGVHRNKRVFQLSFIYDTELINLAKSIGCIWSQTITCWYIENKSENLK